MEKKFNIVVGEDGTVKLPDAVLEKLEVKPGEEVRFEVDDNFYAVRLLSRIEAERLDYLNWMHNKHLIFDLIGIPFLKAGNNDTPFVVYQNDFKEILMKQPIAVCFAKAEKLPHLTNRHGGFGSGRFSFSV